MTERQVLLRYSIVSFVVEFSVWLPVPVLILHMNERGLDLAVIGLMLAIRSLLVVALEIPSGGLADAIGRKPVAVAAQVFTLASFVVLLYLAGPGLLLAYAVLQAVGSALHSGALDSWFVESLKRADEHVDIQRNLARVTAVQAVAMLLGAGLGGWIPQLAAPALLPWPLAAFGITIVASIAFRVVALLITQVVITEDRSTYTAGLRGALQVPLILKDAVQLVRRLPAVPWLLLASFVSGVALISLETFWQPVAALTFGGEAESSGAFGLLGTLMGVAILAGSLLIAQWGSRFPGGPVMLAATSQGLKGTAMVLMTVFSGPAGLAVFLFLSYGATAANNAPHDTLLHRAIPDSRRSVMLSLNSLAFFLGTAVGSSSLGWLAEAASPLLALAVGGIITVLGALCYLGVLSVNLPEQTEVSAAEEAA